MMQPQTPQHQLKNYFDELLIDSLSENLEAEEKQGDINNAATQQQDDVTNAVMDNLDECIAEGGIKEEDITEKEIVEKEIVEEDIVEPTKAKEPIKPAATSVAPVDTQSLPQKDHTAIPSVLNDVATGSAYIEHKQRLERLLEDVSVSEDDSIITEEVLNTTAVIEPTEIPNQLKDIAWLENGRPSWAQEHFEILLVEVGGLKLAVPLQALGQIQPMNGELTPLFGQSDWFMGLQKTPMGNVKTVNTAKFVMPERYQEQSKEQLSYVVSINGSDWGLAVDAIDQPSRISPEAIRWRTKRTERAWMAGTVKDHMCVLLDIPALAKILMQKDKNHHD